MHVQDWAGERAGERGLRLGGVENGAREKVLEACECWRGGREKGRIGAGGSGEKFEISRRTYITRYPCRTIGDVDICSLDARLDSPAMPSSPSGSPGAVCWKSLDLQE